MQRCGRCQGHSEPLGTPPNNPADRYFFFFACAFDPLLEGLRKPGRTALSPGLDRMEGGAMTAGPAGFLSAESDMLPR